MPERVGKYTILRTIGPEAPGTVFLASDPDLGREVAIKQLAPQLATDPEFLDRFRHETPAMERLVHPNCVQVFELVEEKGGAFVVSDHVAGTSLRKILDDDGRLTPEQALAVTRGLLSGLAFAHELGLVHRDIKPENLLAAFDGTIRVIDFGQVAFTGEVAGGARQTTGSPAYMSPEHVRGESGGVRSDIYAAGAVMYELLAGRPPFVALSRMAVMRMHMERQPPDLSRVNPRVPARLTAVVNQALSKEAQDRYSSAGEFQAVLEEVARDSYGADWIAAGTIVDLVALSADPRDVPAVEVPAPPPAEEAPVEEAPVEEAPVEEPVAEVPAPAETPVLDYVAAQAEAAPVAEQAEPAPITRRRPGIARGIVAVIAGLLAGTFVSFVAPPAYMGVIPAAAFSDVAATYSERIVPLSVGVAVGLVMVVVGLVMLRRGGPRA